MKRWAARTDSENGSDRESIILPQGRKKRGVSHFLFCENSSAIVAEKQPSCMIG